MKRRIRAVICVISLFVIVGISAYLNSYYSASEEVINAVESAQQLNNDLLVFKPEDTIECGLIFYPGGKVEYTAYATLLEQFSKEGILCVLVKMPCNLAVLDVNAAEGIREQFPDVNDWYMAGHSLGGSMAASYIADNIEGFDGLVLMAAYSTEDLSSTGLEVLSIYGTEDKVLNQDKYEEYKDNLPDVYEEYIIAGGCHAYFGNYGEQEGDGRAEINVEEQQKATVEIIKQFVK